MKILLISIGTRGDMEPFLAIGEILKEKGEQVICAFPEQYKNLAVESGFEFFSLGSKFIELLESDIGKAAMGSDGSGFKKFMAILKLAGMQTEANKELVHKQFEIIEREKPDRIVYNAKVGYPLIWELKNKAKTILISPVPYLHYTKNNTHILFNSNYGAFLNKLTFSLADFGLVTTTMISKKWLGLKERIKRKQIKNVIQNNKAIYTISPSLFAKPENWRNNLQILGYHERNKTINWEPSQELIEFTEKHSKILFITFGSMTNTRPEEKTKIFLDILERNKTPVIINTASGGIKIPEKYNTDLFHFVDQIPYDYIFPKVYAVIHHGGSGTTHMALKYACASMIIPHIIDQFVWNNIISEKGLGPKWSFISFKDV